MFSFKLSSQMNAQRHCSPQHMARLSPVPWNYPSCHGIIAHAMELALKCHPPLLGKEPGNPF